MCQGDPSPLRTVTSSNPYSPFVSAPLILTISSIPSNQCASPSSLPSRYPSLVLSVATVISSSDQSWYNPQLSISEQLQRGLSQIEESLSSPSPERLRAWR